MTYPVPDCEMCGTAVSIENGIATELHSEACPVRSPSFDNQETESCQRI